MYYSMIHYALSQWQGVLAIILIILGLLFFIHGMQSARNTTFGNNRENRHTFQALGVILLLAGIMTFVITFVLSQQPISTKQYNQMTQQVKQAPASLKPQLKAYLKRHHKITRMDYHNFKAFYTELHDEYKRHNRIGS